MKTEGGICHRFGRIFKELALARRWDANMRIGEVEIRQTGATQQGLRVDVTLPKSRNRTIHGEGGHCRRVAELGQFSPSINRALLD
jgi:hypothetical protein